MTIAMHTFISKCNDTVVIMMNLIHFVLVGLVSLLARFTRHLSCFINYKSIMGCRGSEKIMAAYDSTLLGMLQNEGGLESFLDVIFGFLARKTDFYLTMHNKTDKYGFPKGVAKKIILNYFDKYHSVAQQMQEIGKQRSARKPEPTSSASITEIDDGETEPASVDIQTTESAPLDDDKPETEEVKIEQQQEQPSDSNNDVKSTEASQAKANENVQVLYQSNPDSYNGAIRDNYSWSQNYDDVDVKIPVSGTIRSAKKVSITIERKHLKVLIRQDDGSFKTVINNELQYETNREESMWSLEPGKHIDITLTKARNVWWSKLLMNEDEIDVQKICPERSMADMDEEEKAVINKLQFDDHQKKLGLPQSHELKVHEMLKKGWDAEGSPFKGQEFDPSAFNISPSAVDA